MIVEKFPILWVLFCILICLGLALLRRRQLKSRDQDVHLTATGFDPYTQRDDRWLEVSLGQGYFIAFEGLDGSGKSTQIELLASSLRELGHDVVVTGEPGGTDLGDEIRSLLLDGYEMSARTETLLFLANRSNHVERVIRPALEAGKIVICSRYTGSTLSFQGYGRGLSLDDLTALNDFATEGLAPDLTIWLDVPVDVSSSRRGRDRIEREDADFYERVRDGLFELAVFHHWAGVDGTRAVDEVARYVWGYVERSYLMPAVMVGLPEHLEV